MDQSDFRKMLFAKKPAEEAAPPPAEHTGRGSGTVKAYDPSKGFGFIIPDDPIALLDGGDLFVHKKALLGTNYLKEDQRVNFEVKEVNGRAQAAGVSLGDAPPEAVGGTAKTFEQAMEDAGGDAGKITGLVLPKASADGAKKGNGPTSWSTEWRAKAEANKKGRRPLTGEQKKQKKENARKDGEDFTVLCALEEAASRLEVFVAEEKARPSETPLHQKQCVCVCVCCWCALVCAGFGAVCAAGRRHRAPQEPRLQFSRSAASSTRWSLKPPAAAVPAGPDRGGPALHPCAGRADSLELHQGLRVGHRRLGGRAALRDEARACELRALHRRGNRGPQPHTAYNGIPPHAIASPRCDS